jgi:Rne/Rng family ribonuclease
MDPDRREEMDNTLKWLFLPQGDKVLSCLFDDGKMLECRIDDQGSGRVGSIFTARVENIVPAIRAAFLAAGGEKFFLPVSDTLPPFFTAQAREGKLTVGDELLVQEVSEEQKGKYAVVRESLEIDGRYCVVIAPGNGLRFSKKITDLSWREELKDRLRPVLPEGRDVIIRTNAVTAGNPRWRKRYGSSPQNWTESSGSRKPGRPDRCSGRRRRNT